MAKINFNEPPYYDDYVPSKRFQKILFKPAVAIQARELNQFQSILRENTKNISNVILDNGDLLKPGQLIYSDKADYVTLATAEPWNNYHFNPIGRNASGYLIGKHITDGNTRIKAYIITGAASNVSRSESAVLYLAYSYSDGDQNSQNITFTSGDDLYELREDGTRGDQIGVVGKPSTKNYPNSDAVIGQGSLAQIKSGIYYINGTAVPIAGQTLILEKFGTTPTYRIGLAVEESIVTSMEDSTLFDNVGESIPNSGAPGADRYKYTLTLAKKSVTTEANESFIELMRVTDGHVARKDRYLDQLFTEDDYKSNHQEIFGDYVSKPFNVEVREHNSSQTDSNGIAGYYGSGDSEKLVVGVDSGSVVLKGEEISVPVKQFANIDKQRTLSTSGSSVSVSADLGSFVVTDNGIDMGAAEGNTPNDNAKRNWLNFSPTLDTDSATFTIVRLEGTSANLGTARVRNIERTADNDEYRIYLFNIDFIEAGSKMEDVEELQTLAGVKICDLNTEFDVITPNIVTSTTTVFTAGSFDIGTFYEIVTVGNTDFTLIGASANTVGVTFIATGAGTGTGTVIMAGEEFGIDTTFTGISDSFKDINVIF